MTVITVVSVFFFNCSDIYLASWNCIEDGDQRCEQYGDVGWLDNKPSDVLIILDNSPKGQELNPHVTSNLGQLLKCMRPADWRVGVVSDVAKGASADTLGELINLEMDGEISVRKFITPEMKKHRAVFSDTISLKSGCSFPPYCSEGSRRPLSAIKGFMQKQEIKKTRENRFLRGYASLVIIVVSVSDEKKGIVSDSGTDAQAALASVYEKYDKDEFVGLVVTDAGNTDDCITTAGDFVSKGADGISKVGTIYGLGGLYGVWSAHPLLVIGSQLLSGFTQKSIEGASTSGELMKFARDSGGYAFDICKPDFGAALAYSVLQKIDMQRQFPDECKKFIQPEQRMAKFDNDFNDDE